MLCSRSTQSSRVPATNARKLFTSSAATSASKSLRTPAAVSRVDMGSRQSLTFHRMKVVAGLCHVEHIFLLPFRVCILLGGKLSRASCSLHRALDV